MNSNISFDAIEVGTELPALTVSVTRADLVRYAGASGDFSAIHWDEESAREAGFPTVIAHGMFTMAEAIRVVTDWVGDPAAVVDYGVRFTNPVRLTKEPTSTLIEVRGRVAAKLENRRVRVDVTATSAGDHVLGRSQAVVQLA